MLQNLAVYPTAQRIFLHQCRQHNPWLTHQAIQPQYFLSRTKHTPPIRAPLPLPITTKDLSSKHQHRHISHRILERTQQFNAFNHPGIFKLKMPAVVTEMLIIVLIKLTLRPPLSSPTASKSVTKMMPMLSPVVTMQKQFSANRKGEASGLLGTDGVGGDDTKEQGRYGREGEFEEGVRC